MSSVQPFPLGSSYGAELLATFVSVALWGTTCMQTLVYFVQYPKDSVPLKILVLWLWIADTIHEVLIVEGVYTSLITDFCDYARVSTVVPEFLWQVLLTSLVAIPSQVFFTYRIWRFSGNKWILFALLAPVATFELAGALAFIALGTIIPTAAELVSIGPASVFTAVQAVAAGADITIAAGLVYLLCRSRENALRGSRSILHKLVILSINTGIWTALFAIFTFITILWFKNTLIYAALYFPLCPLYCNTVLANLNARELIRSRAATEADTDTFNLGPVFVHPHSTVRSQQTDPTVSVVQVDVTKSSSRDEDDESATRDRGDKICSSNEFSWNQASM